MTKFHFIKNRKVALIILAAVFLVGILSFIIRGFNIDIDFSGGTEIQLGLGQTVTPEICDDINAIIEAELGHEYVSSTTQSTADEDIAIIRTGTKALEPAQQDKLLDAISAKYEKADIGNKQITVVKPTIGTSLTKKGLLAVGIAVVLMLIYIWFRFDLASGIAAVCSLVHDLFVMMTVYSLLQIPINLGKSYA